MAVLEKIIIGDFRNIESAEMTFSPKINCICGNNGEGKTNLVDAIHYLSMTKSAFQNSDRQNFRYGTSQFTISGFYLLPDGLSTRFTVQVSGDGEKKLRRDGKAVKRVSDHIGQFPVVLVSPSDTMLVSDSGEYRRRFVNAVLSQMDAKYLSDLQMYNRYLAQRNKLLKEPSPDRGLLGVLAGKMSELSEGIFEARKDFARDLLPLAREYYRLISGGRECIGISYSSDLSKGSLADILASCIEKDMALGFTSAGLQRDDLQFTLDSHSIRSAGSQGQQKSFLVALKFAQYELMRSGYGFPPILLLDDVFDKLDMDRVSNLIEMVSGSAFGQIFITDSNKVRLQGIVDRFAEDRRYIEASSGSFTVQNYV